MDSKAIDDASEELISGYIPDTPVSVEQIDEITRQMDSLILGASPPELSRSNATQLSRALQVVESSVENYDFAQVNRTR